MRTRRMIGAGLVLAAGMVLGEAALRPSQVAQADDWEWYISNQDVYCEGCCSPGLLCCKVNFACRVQPG